jgi:FimV-like protein
MMFCGSLVHAANAATGSYGPVQQDETLYRIALKYRQTGVTNSQVMMSIYENNPEAFYQGDINHFKVGSLLEIPDLETIGSLDRRQVQHSEMAPVSETPSNPDLVPVVPSLSKPDAEQIQEVQQELVSEMEVAQATLPEPKPEKLEKEEKSAPSAIRYSYEITYINDDNVGLAQHDVDIHDDSIVSATVKAKGEKSLDSFSSWNYGANATYNKFDTFDELDNLEFAINTGYRFAFDSELTSPIYSLNAEIGGLEYESDMRDSTVLSLSAEMSKWLTTTFDMTVGLGFRERDSVSEVFDLSETRIFVNLNTNFTMTDLMYTTLTYIDGDTVSSGTPTLDIVNVADAIEPDDAFGGIDTNQFAYRIDAETWLLTLGYKKILTSAISIDVSARYVDSEAKDDGSVNYDRTILRASLIGRF